MSESSKRSRSRSTSDCLSIKAIENIHRELGCKRGSKQAALLGGILFMLERSPNQRRRTLWTLPLWGECVLWLHDQAQSKGFRQKWNRLAGKHHPLLRQIVFVKVTERGGLSPVPTITWHWADSKQAKGRVIANEA